MKFVNSNKAQSLSTVLGQVSITADTEARLVAGAKVTKTEEILAASKLVVNGDFSAGALDAKGKLELATIDLNGAAATKVEASKAEIAVAATGISATAPAGNISYTVGGKVAIAPPVCDRYFCSNRC